MLGYYAMATVLVVTAVTIGVALHRPGRPLEVAAVQATGTPGAPRPQAASVRTPEPVTGQAPWALSAFPECFRQDQRVRGPAGFVRPRLPAGLQVVPKGARVRSADCTVEVLRSGLRLIRGDEELQVPDARLFVVFPLGGAALRELVVLREDGAAWELRRYHSSVGAAFALSAPDPGASTAR